MPAKFFQINAKLQSILERVLEETWATFPQLAQNQIAVTWVVYEPPYRVNTGGALSAEDFWQYQPMGASYRGVELIPPDSLVNLFYLVAAHVWLEQGMIQPSPELERALTDMMAGDNPDATGYVLDVLSGTTSGPELPSGPFETWQHQRNIVNRYFQQLGWAELRAVNMNQKLWPAAAYGREHDFLGTALENRNLLTTEATARLLHSIIGGVSVSAARSQMMMALLNQGPFSKRPSKKEPLMDAAGHKVIATDVWSQSAQTHRVSHEATYIEAPGSHPFLAVIFTEGKQIERQAEVVPFVLQRLSKVCQELLESSEFEPLTSQNTQDTVLLENKALDPNALDPNALDPNALTDASHGH